MRDNRTLHSARAVKNDEFYTGMEEIEMEMPYYFESFAGKSVYCNCDDYRSSNFAAYFRRMFGKLGLKSLTCTGYSRFGRGVYFRKDASGESDGTLSGDGDFRSGECMSMLGESDIVVTNPPFSMFRKYFSVLTDSGVGFIVLSNNNALTYREVFPHIGSGRLWLGRTLFTGTMPYFRVPDWFKPHGDWERRPDGLYARVNSVCWLTNLPNDGGRKPLPLVSDFLGGAYPAYENADAVECCRVKDYPKSYYGTVGIPITGLKYMWSDGTVHVVEDGAESRLSIVGFRKGDDGRDLRVGGRTPYFRVLVRRIPENGDK